MGDPVKRLQPDLPLDDLMKQAEQSVPLLEQQAQYILDKLTAENPELMKGVTFEMGPLKEMDSIEKKLPDYDGDYRQVKDLLRGRFVTKTPEQIQAIEKALHELDLDSMNNKYAKPTKTGYRDLNTKVALENGHIGEIQVQQENMLLVNKPTHELMKEANAIKELAESENRMLTPEEAARKADLEAKATLLHNAAAHDGKLNGLVNADKVADFTYTGELDVKGSALGKVAEDLGVTIGQNNRNIAVDVGIAAAVGATVLLRGKSPMEAAEAGAEILNPIPDTTEALLNGGSAVDVAEGAVKDGSALTGCVAGAVGGAKLGAAGGTAVTPGIGTAAGGFVGAIGGCAAGAWVASGITDKIFGFFKGDEEASLDEIREILPEKNTGDMPPEFAALIETQSSDALMQKTLDDLQESGSFELMSEELDYQHALLAQEQQQRLEQTMGLKLELNPQEPIETPNPNIPSLA